MSTKVTSNTYSSYKEWVAALKATYPTAELRVSSGGHLDEYAALPSGKNVAWFGHDNGTGWIEKDVAWFGHDNGTGCIEKAPLTAVAEEPTTAAPKDSGSYTYFKLTSPKLTIQRRGKEVVFKRGDPLGWRFSGSGKFIRLISPLTGPNIVYSIEINDDVLKWLDKQDPNAKRKRGQLKSGRPEDAENRLEGYVVTDGSRYYKLEPRPTFSKKIVQRVLYTKEADAKKFASKFPERKLKVKEVYTKDLGKSL